MTQLSVPWEAKFDFDTFIQEYFVLMYINHLNKEKKSKAKMWSHQIPSSFDHKFEPKCGHICSNHTFLIWSNKTWNCTSNYRVRTKTKGFVHHVNDPWPFGFINHEENYWFVLLPVYPCHLSCMLSLCAWQEISEKRVVASYEVFSKKHLFI